MSVERPMNSGPERNAEPHRDPEGPKWVELRKIRQRGRGDRDRARRHAYVRRGGQKIAAGPNEADRQRRDPVLNGGAPGPALQPLPGAEAPEGKKARRDDHRGRRDERARDAGDPPADQGHDQNVGTGRGLRNREQAGEFRVAHPMRNFDRVPMQFWNHGVGAANRDQRERREAPSQAAEQGKLHHRLQLAATLNRARARTTATRGRRSRPTATKAASMNGTAWTNRRRRSGTAILTAIAIPSPAAAAATWISAPRTLASSATRA